MKFITYILFYTFFLITTAPGAIMLASVIKANCEFECCMNDEAESCDMDMQCCPRNCNTGQCCYCAFHCQLDDHSLQIKTFASKINLQDRDQNNYLSDFTTDCWQPPEMI